MLFIIHPLRRWAVYAVVRQFVHLLFVWLLLAQTSPARGQRVSHEGFEGPDPSWRSAGSDAAYRIIEHARVRGAGHSGAVSEQIRLASSNGSYLYFSHPIDKARVISELTLGVWVKSNQPGIQMLARVVLPRAKDPKTGGPVSTLLWGTSYTAVGAWQQLSLNDMPERLSRQVRVLRSQLGPDVDAREAYVDQVLLNVYSHRGETIVLIDDLEVAGQVALRPERLPAVEETVGGAQTASPSHAGDVRLEGTMLVAAGRPMFPRIIEHRGEPLRDLKQLRFNVVKLSADPTPELLAEADRLGLWLISPLPDLADLKQYGFAERYRPVIAWDLGTGLTAREVESARRQAQQVKTEDPRPGRPLIAEVESELRAYSRFVDVLLIGRSPLGTSLELADYATWLAQRPRLARPGTPIWTRIQTDLDPGLRRQWSVLGAGPAPSAGVDGRQIRLLVHSAIAAGARGLVFESPGPLNAPDPPTHRRRLALELVNLELELIEPWAAAGSFVTSARSSDPEVAGVTLQNERARLLLPVGFRRGDQYLPGPPAAENLSFIVPGVPDSNNAYELTPAGLRPLRHKRVTGGISIWQELPAGATTLITADPAVMSGLSRAAAKVRQRAAQLNRELAARQLELIQGVEQRLAGRPHAGSEGNSGLETAKATMARCDAHVAAGDYASGYHQAQLAIAALGRVQHARWHEAIRSWPSTVTSPFAVNFATLPEHWALADRLRASSAGANRLAGGDFENLDAMLHAGWRHLQHPVRGVNSRVELSPQEPHGGRFSLRLQARPETVDHQAQLVETSPLWLTSAPLQVEAGELVCISGWVRVPDPITGSVDGLVVFDSLGGEALAERIGQTQGWKQFVLYRAADESGSMTITFALSGFGEVSLDDISVQTIRQGPINTAAWGAAAQQRF